MFRHYLALVFTLFFLVSCKSTDSVNNKDGRFKTSNDSQLIFDAVNNISWTKCTLGLRFENGRCVGPTEKRVDTFKGRAYPSERHHYYSYFGDNGHTRFSGVNSFVEKIDEINGLKNLRFPTVEEIISLLNCEKTNYLEQLETGNNGSFCKEKSSYFNRGKTPSVLNPPFEQLVWPNNSEEKHLVTMFYHNGFPYWVSLSRGSFYRYGSGDNFNLFRFILVQSDNKTKGGLVASQDSTGGEYAKVSLKDTPILFIPWKGHKFYADNSFSDENLVHFSDITWLTTLGYATHLYQIGDHVVYDRYVKFRTESGQIVYLSYNDFKANDYQYENIHYTQEKYKSDLAASYRSFLFNSEIPSYSRKPFWFNFDKSALELIVKSEKEYHRMRLIEIEESRKADLVRAAKEQKEKEREEKRQRDFAEQLKRPEPRLGMTKDAVRNQTSWGAPDRTSTVQQVGGTVEFWYYQIGYSHRQLVFSDGVLIQIIR